MFSIKDDKIKYNDLVKISKQLISFCLNKNLGVIFNFLGYDEELINKLESNFYFSISDDFFQLNSEYLNTSDIEVVESDEGKQTFYKKFSFFDEIYNILIESGINNISLLISCGGSSVELNNFKFKRKKEKSLVEILYETIIEEKDEYAYGFPEIIITSI